MYKVDILPIPPPNPVDYNLIPKVFSALISIFATLVHIPVNNVLVGGA